MGGWLTDCYAKQKSKNKKQKREKVKKMAKSVNLFVLGRRFYLHQNVQRFYTKTYSCSLRNTTKSKVSFRIFFILLKHMKCCIFIMSLTLTLSFFVACCLKCAEILLDEKVINSYSSFSCRLKQFLHKLQKKLGEFVTVHKYETIYFPLVEHLSCSSANDGEGESENKSESTSMSRSIREHLFHLFSHEITRFTKNRSVKLFGFFVCFSWYLWSIHENAEEKKMLLIIALIYDEDM